jgi:hypothetical protein
MASRGTTFAKQERDRAKKAKAAAKRERREDRSEGTDEPVEVGEGPISPDELLTVVARLQEDLESGRIDLDEFEERKAELAARIDLG